MIRRLVRQLAVCAFVILALVGSPGPALGQGAGAPALAPGQPGVPARPVHRSFDDEFSRARLDPRWTWVNENPSTWSLTERPGFLRLTTISGSLGAGNMLLQATPAGDFEVRTHLFYSPSANHQSAGIVLYNPNGDHLGVAISYCDIDHWLCGGVGAHFDGKEGGAFLLGIGGLPTVEPGEAYLRLVRRGATYSAYYSADGTTWQPLGEHTPPAGVSYPLVGLTAAQDQAGTAPVADFDYFRYAGPFADVIYTNGTVLTMEGTGAQAQAIAIRDDTILAVGGSRRVLTFRGPETQVIDLGGRTLMPGFADGHTHVLRHPDRYGQTLDDAVELCLRMGLTSVTEMSADQAFIDELMAAESEGRLRLRVNVFPEYNAAFLDGEGHSIYEGVWFTDHDPILDSDRMLRIPGVKFFVDGSYQPGRGCPARSEPYPEEVQTDPYYDFAGICGSPTGDLYLDQATLNQAVADVQARGYRAAFHAMGDRAIDTVLNAVEYALAGGSNDVYRHEIEHSSSLRPDQIDRYFSLGIIASVRGAWPACAELGYDNYLRFCGPDRYLWAANRYFLPGLGVHAFVEGDFRWTGSPFDPSSVAPLDPVMKVWGLVTRQQFDADLNTCPPSDWATAPAISVEQALRMSTLEPAYAVSQEDVLGSLVPGKYADLVILSGSPLEGSPDAIKDLQVLVTMVGGHVEYCAAGQEALCPSES